MAAPPQNMFKISTKQKWRYAFAIISLLLLSVAPVLTNISYIGRLSFENGHDKVLSILSYNISVTLVQRMLHLGLLGIRPERFPYNI